MGNFLGSDEFNVTTENEISVILSHFETEYVFNIIKDNIENKNKPYQMNMPNIVASFEKYFKELISVHESDIDKANIEKVRTETYQEIVDILCAHYGLQYNYNEIQDIYSLAYYMYDFLVSRYNENLTGFYTNYIINEKNPIYDALQLAEVKKNKDSTTLYNKKMYKNTKLAVINSNLERVINAMGGFDITYETILNTIYTQPVARFLFNNTAPTHDFFKDIYMNSMTGITRPILITNIRLEIHRQAVSEDSMNIVPVKTDN